MATTLLNPALWLLAALLASAVFSWTRDEGPQRALARVVRIAVAGPVLALLAVLAAGGAASRIVVGYLAPGSYAEEVLGARSFLDQRQLYHGNDRGDFRRWLSEDPAPIAPWTLPGLTVCQANAAESRPQFYTAQGHSPALLLASVPLVAVAGGRALYGVLTLLSVAAVVLIAASSSAFAGLRGRSRQAVLVLVALLGWQPVLAGLRQGDAVLVVSGLLAATWWLLREGRPTVGGITAAVSSLLLPPVSVILVAVSVASRRALFVATGAILAAAAAMVAFLGPMVLVDYLESTLASARLYAASPMSYSAVGQFLRVSASGAPALWAGVGLLTASAAAVLSARFTRSGVSRTDVSSALGSRADSSMALALTAGFLLLPVAWSQHVALLAIPIVVLLRRVCVEEQTSGGLVALVCVVLLLSLPDQAVGRLGLLLHLSGGASGVTVAPPLPVWAAAGLWGWQVCLCGAARMSYSLSGRSGGTLWPSA